ncbi:MAG: Snf7 family protein [Kiritimatiellae bacterium]|nr:Snf7 family protein [Kiritimatiellia bacterium]
MARLFMSKDGRRKQERRERRRAFRDAENAIENVKDRAKQMDREAKKQWDEARQALKAGEKAKAQRLLTSYRAAQVLMTKLEQKRWVFEQYMTKMEMAQSDQEFSQALGAINKVVKIDPENVADVFETAQDLLGEQMDSDRFWSKLYEKEMDGAAGALEDRIPSVDELSQQLEQEAAVEVGGAATERVNAEIDDRIKSGQERVKKLLDNK